MIKYVFVCDMCGKEKPLKNGISPGMLEACTITIHKRETDKSLAICEECEEALRNFTIGRFRGKTAEKAIKEWNNRHDASRRQPLPPRIDARRGPVCPTCESNGIYDPQDEADHVTYCDDCGQAIMWKGKNEDNN